MTADKHECRVPPFCVPELPDAGHPPELEALVQAEEVSVFVQLAAAS